MNLPTQTSENIDAETERQRGEEAKKNARFSFSFLFSFPALLIILHVSIALYLAYFVNIWKDEASTLYTTQNGFFHALNNASANEKQAPLYFLMMSVWRSLDDSIFFARIFSILASAAAIKFFYDLVLRFIEKPAAKFVAAFFAVNPYLIWASVEVRVYSLVILLSILLLKFFEAAYLESEKSFPAKARSAQKRARIYFVLTAVFALYTNYYLGFLLVGNFLALVVVRRFRLARHYLLQMLPVGILFLPLLWVAKQQFAVRTVGFIAETSAGEGLKILSNQILNFVYPMELSFGSAPSVFSVARICFLLLVSATIIFFIFKENGRRIDEKVLATATVTATVCGFLLAAYFLLGTEYIAIRHFSVLFAPFALFLGVLSTNVLPGKIWIYCAVLFALLFPYTKIYKQYPNFAKRGDWARVARYIEQNEKPNQAIIVFRTFDALSLPYYYKGASPILPGEKFFAWNFEDSPSSPNALRSETAFVVSKIPPNSEEIWLATEEICQNPETAEACRPLENFVEANYTVVDTKDFYSERLRLLRKK